ncbi:MAG: CheR family methyltransferase [Polyangia bacterium]
MIGDGIAARRSGGDSPSLSEEQTIAICDRIAETVGLQLDPAKRREIEVKLSPMLEELAPAELVDRILASEGTLQRAVNLLTIGESYFFRNRPHFDALRNRILPDLIESRRRERRLRIWSAACASGEEPYSLAMLIDDGFPELLDWDVAILATDINTTFLERAEKGVYTDWAFRGVDERLRDTYFTRLGESRYRLADRIRERVELRRFNLADPPFTGRLEGAPFDLVLCRNVLIYFQYELADSVVRAIAEEMVPEGYLLVGHAEAFPSMREMEAIYAHATYYYRNAPRRRMLALEPSGAGLSIPGLPVAPLPPPQPERPASEPPSGPSRLPSVPPPPIEESASAELARAREHAEMGEVEEAQRLLDELLSGEAKLVPRAHFLQALVYDQSGRPGDALFCLRRALFLEKEFAIAHYYQGVICEREGDPGTARRCFRNVLSLVESVPEETELAEGGNVNAGRLAEIVRERIRESELEE